MVDEEGVVWSRCRATAAQVDESPTSDVTDACVLCIFVGASRARHRELNYVHQLLLLTNLQAL